VRNTLTVRPLDPGMQEPEKVRPFVSRTSELADELVILIHGYHNSFEKAGRSYERFQELLGRSPIAFQRLGPVWEFHWPGDHPWGAISLASYATRIPDAAAAGGRLADFLEERPRRQTFHIIAHSLGCRVALSAIRQIRETTDYDGARIGQVFLLAAAVPARFCEDALGRPFRRPFERSSEHVFFSRRDRALRAAPVGHFVYGERGQGPAVGLEGMPTDRWATRNDMNLGHSDYWKSPQVARAIAAAFAPASWRALQGRSLPSSGAQTRKIEAKPPPSQRIARRAA
jgi:alpha/beta hydrolase family protein DUF900